VSVQVPASRRLPLAWSPYPVVPHLAISLTDSPNGLGNAEPIRWSHIGSTSRIAEHLTPR